MGVENERKGKIVFGFVFYLNKLNFFKVHSYSWDVAGV